jgi:hypothetical protein
MADTPNDDPMARIADALVADLLSLSDAELLADAEGDVERDAAVSRAIIAGALVRLAGSRPSKANDASPLGGHPVRRPGFDVAKLLQRVVGNDVGPPHELTLAARNGNGLSSREFEEIVRDLDELGAFENGDSQAD